MEIALLSQMAYLRRSFPIFFIPLSPSNLRPFGAPPSIGRRECPREPLPLEGAAERSEAGLVSFWGGEAASSLPSPFGKGDRAATLSYTMLLRRSSRSLSYRQNPIRPPFVAPSPLGKGFVSGTATLSQMPCLHSAQTKTALRGRALQSGSGSIILRSRILRDFSAYPHHFLS